MSDPSEREAAVRDKRQRRASILDGVYLEIETALGRLRDPHIVFAFGGRDNTYAEHELATMPPRDVLAVLQAVNHGADIIKKLQEMDPDHGLATMESMLGRLAQRLGVNDPPTESGETA